MYQTRRRLLVLGIVSTLLLVICGAAILLLSVTGWLFFRPEVPPPGGLGGQVVKQATLPPSPLNSSQLNGSQFRVENPELTKATSTPLPSPIPLIKEPGSEADTAEPTLRAMFIPTVTPTPLSKVPGAKRIGPTPTPVATPTSLPPPTAIINQPGIATRLVIPKLDLDTPILFAPIENQTWRVSHLGQLVGHLEGTAPPGSNSNMVLAGHVTLAAGVYGPFAGLGQLAPGDLVIVYDNDKEFHYIIDNYQTVDRTAIEVVYPSDTGQITLITCNNWNNEEGRYRNRLIVKGYLVNN